MLNRHLRVATLLILGAAVLAAPAGVRAADPPLGEAVTLPDGTVLPPLPADQFQPTAQAEMLAEHGGLVPDVPADAANLDTASGSTQAVEAAAPLVVAADTAAVGPAGPLPNQLRREVLGFLPYWKLDARTRGSLRMDFVSTIAYFSIGVQSNGFLARGPATAPTVGWKGWTSPEMTAVINAAHARGVRVVPTITFMAWNGNYTGMSTFLNNAGYRARLAADVVKIVRERRVDGVNIDFEPVPSSLRTQFTTLVREIKAALVSARVGSYVTVDTMAGAATWATGYDVVGLTASGAADALMVMAYDFHYAASVRAGGVSPIESPTIFAAADAMRAHVARVPARKLIWGVPYYGRAWNTSTAALNSPVRSPASSVAFEYYWTSGGTPAGGKILAQQHGRKWDATGQVPWFVFRAADGGYRQGYYDDPASLRVKYDMVLRNGAAGIGIWTLGMDTGVPDLWNMIEDRFLKHLTRWAGSDRYATAARVSQATFAPGVPVAYVATGTNFPDALAAGPAAARTGGPVLLTAPTFLPAATANELARLRPARIIVMGGTTMVSDGVLASLRGYATNGSVTRIAAGDRYGTAARLSATTFAPGAPVAYIASGTSFPDALSGGVAAGRQKGPMLLVAGGTIPRATASELSRLKPKAIVVLGGPGAVSDSVLAALRPFAAGGAVSRLAGSDRYTTSVAISRATTGNDAPRVVFIATGAGFADGLAGTPAAVLKGGPLLIVPPTGLTTAIAGELRRLNPPRIVILGGTGAVPAGVAAQIAALWD